MLWQNYNMSKIKTILKYSLVILTSCSAIFFSGEPDLKEFNFIFVLIGLITFSYLVFLVLRGCWRFIISNKKGNFFIEGFVITMVFLTTAAFIGQKLEGQNLRNTSVKVIAINSFIKEANAIEEIYPCKKLNKFKEIEDLEKGITYDQKKKLNYTSLSFALEDYHDTKSRLENRCNFNQRTKSIASEIETIRPNSENITTLKCSIPKLIRDGIDYSKMVYILTGEGRNSLYYNPSNPFHNDKIYLLFNKEEPGSLSMSVAIDQKTGETKINKSYLEISEYNYGISGWSLSRESLVMSKSQRQTMRHPFRSEGFFEVVSNSKLESQCELFKSDNILGFIKNESFDLRNKTIMKKENDILEAKQKKILQAEEQLKKNKI